MTAPAPNLIVISGATASGKTELASKLAQKLQTEIISADSRQIYKYLNIGTNKDLKLKQHLIDIINPDEKYSAANFVRDASEIISRLNTQGAPAIVAGGTGLYIKALLYGLDDMPPPCESLRAELSHLSPQALYEKLYVLDVESAEKNRANPQRLLRALEVNILTGSPVSASYKPKTAKYSFAHFAILPDRPKLYEKINLRCKQMLETGMVEETQKVLSLGYAKNCYGLSGIGYRHVVEYLDGKINKEDLLAKFSQYTRNYAKRQYTWFSHQPDITVIENDFEKLLDVLRNICHNLSRGKY